VAVSWLVPSFPPRCTEPSSFAENTFTSSPSTPDTRRDTRTWLPTSHQLSALRMVIKSQLDNADLWARPYVYLRIAYRGSDGQQDDSNSTMFINSRTTADRKSRSDSTFSVCFPELARLLSNSANSKRFSSGSLHGVWWLISEQGCDDNGFATQGMGKICALVAESTQMHQNSLNCGFGQHMDVSPWIFWHCFQVGRQSMKPWKSFLQIFTANELHKVQKHHSASGGAYFF
jgi:hypothetical protein